MRGVSGALVSARAEDEPVLAAMAVVVQPSIAYADRPNPLPSAAPMTPISTMQKQTFNGLPSRRIPRFQAAGFLTTCDADGCTAHWFGSPTSPKTPTPQRCSTIGGTATDRVSSPYPFHCDGGWHHPTTRSDFLNKAQRRRHVLRRAHLHGHRRRLPRRWTRHLLAAVHSPPATPGLMPSRSGSNTSAETLVSSG